MKLTLIFLTFFVASTLQQGVYWRPPIPHFYPYFYGRNGLIQENYPSYQRSGIPYYSNNLIEDEKVPGGDGNMDYVSPRFFGLGKLNLVNTAASLLRSTVTSYTTTVSTLSVNTIATCFTSSMFSATTACRRKRSIRDISIGDVNAEPPTRHENADIVIEQLPKEGRDMEPSLLIQSSLQDQVAGTDLQSNSPSSEVAVDEFVRKERQLLASLFGTTTVTSTVTSYSISYSTSTTTNSKLAATTALSCLPSGFKLC